MIFAFFHWASYRRCSLETKRDDSLMMQNPDYIYLINAILDVSLAKRYGVHFFNLIFICTRLSHAVHFSSPGISCFRDCSIFCSRISVEFRRWKYDRSHFFYVNSYGAQTSRFFVASFFKWLVPWWYYDRSYIAFIQLCNNLIIFFRNWSKRSSFHIEISRTKATEPSLGRFTR